MIKLQSAYTSRYFYLLFSLVGYFIISALYMGDKYDDWIIAIIFTLIILFCMKIAITSRWLQVVTIMLGVVALLGRFYLEFVDTTSLACLSHFIVAVVFLSIITGSVIYSVTNHSAISVDTLLGAICGYLLLGFTWTFIYLTIQVLSPHAFTVGTINHNFGQQVQVFTYFSFTSLTTTGYGDIYPLTNGARVWSWLEAVTGQVYLAVWISQLVGLHIAQKNGNH